MLNFAKVGGVAAPSAPPFPSPRQTRDRCGVQDCCLKRSTYWYENILLDLWRFVDFVDFSRCPFLILPGYRSLVLVLFTVP